MTVAIDLDKIKADPDVDKRVLEVYTYLKAYMDEQPRKDWIERRKKAWDAIENEFWEEKDKKDAENQGQVIFNINKCNKGVQGASAMVTDQKPEVKFFPVGSGDLYIAELLKRAWDFVWAKNEGQDEVYDGVEECKVGGINFWDIYHDPSKGIFGRVMFETTPPDDIYWDKDSRKRDFSDTHIIKAKLRTKSYIMENYEGIKEEDLFFERGTKDDAQKSSGLTGKDNYAEGKNDEPPPSGVYKQPEEFWEIEGWMLKKVKENWLVRIENGEAKAERMILEKGQNPEEVAANQGGRLWPRMIEKRFQRIIVGKKLVEEVENPHGEDADGNPLMSLIALRHQRTRTSYPMSPTNYAVDINKSKSKRRMQYIHAASHLINAPIIEPEGKVKWVPEGSNPGTPGTRAQVSNSAGFQVTRLQSGGVDLTHLVQLEEHDDRDIDDQYDMHDLMRGKIPPGQDNIAGRTVLALQDMGSMMSKPFLRALESSLVRLAKVGISLVLRHWPRQMWERLLEPDEKPPDGSEEDLAMMEAEGEDHNIRLLIATKYQEALDYIRPADPEQPPGISLLDLDVRITAGSSMPTNRIAKGEFAMEMVDRGVYDAEAALEYIDDPMKDKVVARLKNRQSFLEEQEIMKAGGQK